MYRNVKLIQFYYCFRVPHTEHFHELEKFGCTVPNCKSTEWFETKADTAIIPGGRDRNKVSAISYNFPSTIKVGAIYPFQI